jgi:signal transduction histidine kinase
LEQILLNLGTNAINHGWLMGRRKVVIRFSSRGPRGKKKAIRIAVSDNGPGIARDRIGRLFKLGFTTTPHGQGFGLPICRRFAKRLNGRISLAKTIRYVGSRFVLELPPEAGQ